MTEQELELREREIALKERELDLRQLKVQTRPISGGEAALGIFKGLVSLVFYGVVGIVLIIVIALSAGH